MHARWKDKVRPLVLLVAALCLAAPALAGCEGPRDVADAALGYYQHKYGTSAVEVTGRGTWGNYGLFGFEGDDVYVTLSDGSTVVWDAESGRFYDDRQAGEIGEAIEREVIAPAVSCLGPGAVHNGDYEVNARPYTNVKGSMFTTYYDGDIESFLREEQPRVVNLLVGCIAGADSDYVSHTEDFARRLESHFGSLDVRVLVYDSAVVASGTLP